jgi:hypothetical protein
LSRVPISPLIDLNQVLKQQAAKLSTFNVIVTDAVGVVPALAFALSIVLLLNATTDDVCNITLII